MEKFLQYSEFLFVFDYIWFYSEFKIEMIRKIKWIDENGFGLYSLIVNGLRNSFLMVKIL